jgi:DNA-binding NarL/FixJ family response regulator
VGEPHEPDQSNAKRGQEKTSSSPTSSGSARGHPHGFTRREAEVAELLARGLSDAAIAEQLVISRRTAEHHVSSILAKVGVGSRRALVASHAAEE